MNFPLIMLLCLDRVWIIVWHWDSGLFIQGKIRLSDETGHLRAYERLPLLTAELPFLTVPRRSWLRNSSLDNWMSRLTAQSPAYRSPSPYSSVYEDKSSEMKREETNCILCILHWRLLCLVVREVEWLSSNLSWAGLGRPKLDDQILFEPH